MLNTPRAHLVEPRGFFFENTVDSVEDAASNTQPDAGEPHNAAATPRAELPTLLRAGSLEEVGAQAVGGKAAVADSATEMDDVAVLGLGQQEALVAGRPGRVAIAEHEGVMCFSIQKCSKPSMDAFMQENAAGLVLQGFETIVPSADDPDVSYAYVEPRRFGPYRAQVRITTKVVFAPGKVEIQILDMILGLADKKTGEIDFEGQSLKLLFKTENTITWKENGSGGMDVVNRSWSRSETRLPWWFPVPDSVMQRMITFFVRQVVANGQRQTNAKLQAKFQEWSSQHAE